MSYLTTKKIELIFNFYENCFIWTQILLLSKFICTQLYSVVGHKLITAKSVNLLILIILKLLFYYELKEIYLKKSI